MCGAGAEFKADGDVEKYSGAFGGSVKEQSGEIDGEGRMAPGSEASSFGIFLGKPERIELDSRCQVCQIPNCNLYERFGKVYKLKCRCSPLRQNDR